MGISGLQALLQPYAESVSYPATATSTSHSPGRLQVAESAEHSISSPAPIAVVDAPSLAYHAYAIAKAKLFHLQGNASSARHGPAPIPSYAATGAAFIAWLDALQGFGF